MLVRQLTGWQQSLRQLTRPLPAGARSPPQGEPQHRQQGLRPTSPVAHSGADTSASSGGHRAEQHQAEQQQLAARQEEEHAELSAQQRGQQQNLSAQHLAAQWYMGRAQGQMGRAQARAQGHLDRDQAQAQGDLTRALSQALGDMDKAQWSAQAMLDQQQQHEVDQDHQGHRERQDSLTLELEEAERRHSERGGWQQMQQPQEEPPVAAPTGMLSAFLRSCTATTARHVSPFAQAARSFQGAADSHQVQQEQQR